MGPKAFHGTGAVRQDPGHRWSGQNRKGGCTEDAVIWHDGKALIRDCQSNLLPMFCQSTQ